ncbi:MAG: type II toxin-antitoxin system HicA family toxin [Bacteroidales bacterium]|nr:type II toxin-antitoxin system HicA family toxin [Bacteroidales bacterium]
MGSKKKLIKRFYRLPNDFTFDELVRLFAILGFELDNKGATSGSRIRFRNGDNDFVMHKPHPGRIVKPSTLSDVYKYLKNKGLL